MEAEEMFKLKKGDTFIYKTPEPGLHVLVKVVSKVELLYNRAEPQIEFTVLVIESFNTKYKKREGRKENWALPESYAKFCTKMDPVEKLFNKILEKLKIIKQNK